jgi:hypothetical protein
MPHRPFSLKLLLLETSLLAIRSWGRAWAAGRDAERYEELGTDPPLFLFLSFNLFWGLGFTILTIGLWRGQRWAGQSLLVILVIFGVSSLLWYDVFVQSEYDQQRITFLIVLVICGLLGNFWLISRPKVRRVFKQPSSHT